MAVSRTRLGAAAAVAVAAAVALAVLLAGGASGEDSAKLSWHGKVEVFDSGIPTDRILYTQVRNTSLEDVDLAAADLRALDAQGREVESAGRFLAAFAHGIFPWSEKDQAGDDERRRLGEIATLKPGQAIPVTLAWSVPKGAEQPVRVDFGPVELPLPRR